MSKTSGAIEQDIFDLLRNSSLKNLISGNIYKSGMRPMDAQTEDIVVKFLTGRDYQIQDGMVNINAYVADIDNSSGKGTLVKNTRRCNEIADALNSFVKDNFIINEYKLELDEIIRTLETENEQHFVNCRVRFKRITF